MDSLLSFELNPDELFKPNLTLEIATGLVRKIYGLDVTQIKRMVSFNDQNFHIQVSKHHNNPYIQQVSDHGFVLKIINTMKSSMEGHFDSMHAAIEHLNKKGLRTPLPVRNLEGNTWQMQPVPILSQGSNDPMEKECGVHLLTYIPGMPVTAVDNTPDVLFQWGSLLGKLHNAMEDLDCPNLREKVIFSALEYIPIIEHFIPHLDDEEKPLVVNVLERFQTEVAVNLDNLPKGFLHGDFNGHNILMQVLTTEDDKHLQSVDGILDFEDMHHGPYIWDLGLMLAHVLMDSTTMDPLEAVGHALAGYKSLRQLNDLELSVLKTCMECRLCQSWVFCNYSSKLDPNNSYVLNLSSTDSAKKSKLLQLQAISNTDILEKWNHVMKQH